MKKAKESRDNLHGLSLLLHGLSHLNVLFMMAALYFQVRSFLFLREGTAAGREQFVTFMVLSFTMWGFFMSLLSLSDNDRLKPAEIRKFRDKQRFFRRLVMFMIVAFLLTVLQGLYFLLVLHNPLQGVAIVSFGMGGLGLGRQMHDRLRHALSLPEEGILPAGGGMMKEGLGDIEV